MSDGQIITMMAGSMEHRRRTLGCPGVMGRKNVSREEDNSRMPVQASSSRYSVGEGAQQKIGDIEHLSLWGSPQQLQRKFEQALEISVSTHRRPNERQRVVEDENVKLMQRSG